MSAHSTEPNVTSITENRKHQRLPIEVSATLKLADGTEYHGNTVNICFSGAFVALSDSQKLHSYERCLLTLRLQDGDEPMLLNFKCKIRHSKPNGVGVEFRAIFAEDYNDFVYLMVNNSPDPDGLLEEVSQNPGIKIHSK
ncbi:MAG: PilZ domain-containing protein [Gammaproteobacteria bacterium]